jgi:hypothetical protein
VGEAKHQLELALTEAGRDPARALAAHYPLAYVSLAMGDVGQAHHHAQVALELAEQGPDDGVLAQCLACSILMDTLAGRPVAEVV